jgi:hypothetical protein
MARRKKRWPKKFTNSTPLLASALTLALFLTPHPALATQMKEQCVQSFADKARGVISRLKTDYGKIAPSDIGRAAELKRLALLRAMDQASRGHLMGAMHDCEVELSFSTLRPIVMVMVESDRWNQLQLQSILNRIGWPTISKYGAESDRTALLIVQHMGGNLAYRREILAKLETLVAQKQTSGENYALLYDRIQEDERKPQRFGTQGDCRRKTWIPYVIDDAQKVDSRRAALGMPPLARYNAISQKLYCRA